MAATRIHTLSIAGLSGFDGFVKINPHGLKEKFVLLISFATFIAWPAHRIQQILDQYPWISQEFCYETDDGFFGMSALAMCLVVCLEPLSTDEEKIKMARLVIQSEMTRAKTQAQFNFK